MKSSSPRRTPSLSAVAARPSLLVLLLTHLLVHRHSLFAHAFSALASTPAESSQLARLMLSQALKSPSGKLTLSPEIIIPDPTDPTAILLQATEIQKMSEKLRNSAKANAAFIAGSLGNLRTLCAEQEGSRGNFPGPLPVIYCGSGGDVEWLKDGEALADIADAGACGVLIPMNGGEELAAADIALDGAFLEACELALGAGLQPIPEAVVPSDAAGEWGEDDVEKLVEALKEACGGEEPAGLVLSAAMAEAEDDDAEDGEADEDGNDGDEEEEDFAGLPSVAKSLSKRVPILGSVRTPAGGGRIGSCVSSLKDAGYSGAVLRCECVPGYRLNPDLDAVGGFWSAAISDLKSTRSKTFGFRAKVARPGLEKDVPAEWMKYQKSVMESGALGAPEGGMEEDFNPDGGDYKGF